MNVSGHFDTPDSRLADVHDQVMRRVFPRRLHVNNPANFLAVGRNRAVAETHKARSPVQEYFLTKNIRRYIIQPTDF